MSITKINNDRVYYNMAIRCPFGQTSIAASFTENFIQPLLYKPDDFYMSLIRGTFPITFIPIWLPLIQSYPVNTDVNNTIYSITMTYGAFTSGPIYLQYISNDPNITPPPPLSASNPNQDLGNIYYFVYYYSILTQMTNNALKAAYNALNFASGGTLPVGSEPPYFQFNTNTTIYEFIAQIAYYDFSLVNKINVFMNFYLYDLFEGLPAKFYPSDTIQLIVYDQGNNLYNPPSIFPAAAPLYYLMKGEYISITNTYPLRSILIVSNTLPIKNEFYPVKSGLNQSVVNNISLVRDFEPDLSNIFNRSINQFFQTGPHQLINFTSSQPLVKFDIQIFWSSKYGDIFQLTIPYNNTVELKFEFIRKDTFTS